LISFYMKGLDFKDVLNLLFTHNLLSLLVDALSQNEPQGDIIMLSLRTIRVIFKRAFKFYNTRYDHEISIAFEKMKGIDIVEKLLYHPTDKVYKASIKFLERNF
jgi:hypothetical protein